MKKIPKLALGLLALGGIFSIVPAHAALDKADWNLKETGPNSRVWIPPSADLSGAAAPQTTASSGPAASKRPSPKPHAVTELETGMNFWDGKQWSPSTAEFEITDKAFVANRVQHQTTLAGDINTIGAATVVTLDNLTISSTPVALMLFDAESGKELVIATITNSAGSLITPNQVLYQGAFTAVEGGPAICADVLYTLERGSFEQDVVITGRLDPAEWGFPAKTTRIQVITEMYHTNKPARVRRPLHVEKNQAVRSRMASPDLVDETIGYGTYVLSMGRAFSTPTELNKNAGAAVAKQLTTVGDRTFLIESVQYTTVQNALLKLPECGSGGGTARRMLQPSKSGAAYAVIPRPKRLAQVKTPPARLLPESARVAAEKRPGLIVDYRATISGTLSDPTVFQSDTTYLVSGTVYCNAPAIIEGGVVFKYKTNASLVLYDSLTLTTDAYRPAVFTCVDDSSVGDSMNGYSGSGYTGVINPAGYANPAISLQGFPGGNFVQVNLGYCHFYYAQTALQFYCPDTSIWKVSHSQFVSCVRGIDAVGGSLGYGYGSGARVQGFNCLMSSVQYPFVFDSVSADWFADLANCTFADSTRVMNLSLGYGTPPWVSSLNSLFANVSDLTWMVGDHNGFYNSAPFGTASISASVNPFQAVGNGYFYLADTSPFRNAGVPDGLDPDLLASLKKKTVYPPTVVSNPVVYVGTDLNLYPQVARDSYGAPSIGYYYDPIDYAFTYTYVTNATVTVNPGTVITSFTASNNFGFATAGGLVIAGGGQLYCNGTPTNPVRFVQSTIVQEQRSNSSWTARPYAFILPSISGASPASVINCRFTDFSSFVQDCNHLAYGYGNAAPVNLQDCRLHGGIIDLENHPINLTNCLLERVNSWFFWDDDALFTIRNNLFYGGDFEMAVGATNEIIKDNLFDRTTISADFTGWGYDGGYNAYVTNCATILPTYVSDIVLTNTDYLAGPLGPYYYPTNGGNLSRLTNSGSITANLVGLYHFTTQVDQRKELNSVVDRGFHYVAVDANGNPLDSDGDGIADWIEDINGNGTVESGETDWQSATDLGLKVIITRPKNNSIIP